MMQGLFICPEIQNNFVPIEFFTPKLLYHLAPFCKIVGIVAIVSTLLTRVGQPYKPILAGKGGLRRGCPFLPSKLSIKALSSPQIYAPAPR